MKNIDWELKNLDSLKEFIFDDLIGEHPNSSDINEAINTYAERYHEMKLKLLDIANVVGQSEQLPKNNCTLNRKTCGKGSGCKYPHCHI